MEIKNNRFFLDPQLNDSQFLGGTMWTKEARFIERLEDSEGMIANITDIMWICFFKIAAP